MKTKPHLDHWLDLNNLGASVRKFYTEQAIKAETTIQEYLINKLIYDYMKLIDTQQPQPPLNATRPTSTTTTSTKSGYKGVYPYGKRWMAMISDNGAQRRLGVCDTPEEAAKLYDNFLVLKANDPGAAINFPTAENKIAQASEPYINKLAAGQPITDIDMRAWMNATMNISAPVDVGAPLPVLPPGTDQVAKAPLIDRPAITLYTRNSAEDE